MGLGNVELNSNGHHSLTDRPHKTYFMWYVCTVAYTCYMYIYAHNLYVGTTEAVQNTYLESLTRGVLGTTVGVGASSQSFEVSSTAAAQSTVLVFLLLTSVDEA